MKLRFDLLGSTSLNFKPKMASLKHEDSKFIVNFNRENFDLWKFKLKWG